MEKDLIKPIEAYECNICGKLILGTEEEALKHAKIPSDNLTEGLVYLSKNMMGSNIFNVIFKVYKVDEDHEFSYLVIHYSAVRPNDPSNIEVRSASNGIRRRFKEGMFTFCTQEEFEEFKKGFEQHMENFTEYPLYTGPSLKETHKLKEQLIRTTPELEELVVEKQSKK